MERDQYYQSKIERYSHDKDLTHQSEMNVLVQNEEMNLFTLLKPKLYRDGNVWCVLFGDNSIDGIAGYGETPMLAIYDFNKKWHEPITNLKKSEKQKIEDVNKMCIESLSPDEFEKWESVVKSLTLVRASLNAL